MIIALEVEKFSEIAKYILYSEGFSMNVQSIVQVVHKLSGWIDLEMLGFNDFIPVSAVLAEQSWCWWGGAGLCHQKWELGCPPSSKIFLEICRNTPLQNVYLEKYTPTLHSSGWGRPGGRTHKPIVILRLKKEVCVNLAVVKPVISGIIKCSLSRATVPSSPSLRLSGRPHCGMEVGGHISRVSEIGAGRRLVF